MSISVLMYGVSGFLGMSGTATVATDFDPSSPWYGLGVMAVAVASGCGLTGMVLSHRSRVVAAFDIGYVAGYRKGIRRGRPVVVDVRERQRERERRRGR